MNNYKGSCWSMCFINTQEGFGVHRNNEIFYTSDNAIWGILYTIPDPNTHGPVYVTDIIFTSSTEGWAVGTNDSDEGFAFHTTNKGLIWSSYEAYDGKYLVGICSTSINELYIIGFDHLILQSTNGGLNWSNVSPSLVWPPTQWASIKAKDGEAWVCGENGKVYIKENSTSSWKIQYSDTSSDLNDICMINKYYGWAVGEDGTILRYGY